MEVEESKFCLAVGCIYTINVWSQIENKLQLKYKWEGDSVEICLKNWCLKEEWKDLIYIYH